MASNETPMYRKKHNPGFQSAKYVNETPLKPPFPKGVTIWIWRFGSKRGFANSAKCTYRCFLIIKYPRILIHVKL